MNSRLAVQPHDLLWGLSVADLPADVPAWVVDVVRRGHPVVVRRAIVSTDAVAVGVRGRSRGERYAAVLKRCDIVKQIKPEQLIDAQLEHDNDWSALRALRQVFSVMSLLDLPWGVAGSVGFELASGVPVLHQDSDLDLILRTDRFFSRQQAAQLVKALEGRACRIDLQLQTPSGAVALREWAGQAQQVLLKSDDGARLVSNPWQLQACPA